MAGRGVNLRGRLAALERAVVLCRSCAAAGALRAELAGGDGTELIVRFGDGRDYCGVCGRRPGGGAALRRGRGSDAGPS